MDLSDFENLDEEVKELLQNYKHKKATAYEPCTLKNFKECLIGLSEELGLLNIDFIFNPYLDIENNTLQPESLMKLINSVWVLLHHYKNTAAKAESLAEQHHLLEHSNKQLNGNVKQLKEKLCLEKNESRACVASAQRISDRSDDLLHRLAETRMQLTKVTKQKETAEKAFRNEITKLKRENEKLMDRLRIRPDTRASCTDVCDSTLMQLRERDRKHRAVIAQLQSNNQELLREVLALKEEIILSGVQGFKLDSSKKSK
ncbi:uncharacterized protein LOC128669923 [Plodia interpunctella]|uniref:uncharacterized protein LOC128669923 n=1 Tax=Plodia interpunctella TaxID=58824 RepID=UPI002367A49F|nr:uncharacterized protein LOC128669923 [Plodia interpunctella]